MVVVTLDLALGHVVADVIKAGKTGARDALDTMIRDQEMLLPPHEYHILVLEVVFEVVVREYVAHWLEWLEQCLL